MNSKWSKVAAPVGVSVLHQLKPGLNSAETHAEVSLLQASAQALSGLEGCVCVGVCARVRARCSVLWGPQASFFSSGVPWSLSSAFPLSSYRSGAVARSYPFFRLFFWHFLFLFLISSPFVVPALHDPYFTHSSIKEGCCCACLCVSSGSLKREDFDRFLSSVCVHTPLSYQRVSVQIIYLRSVSACSSSSSDSSRL